MTETTEKVRHVDAVFGGKEVRFELAQDHFHFSLFEAQLDAKAAYGCLQSFMDGRWSVHDVRVILRFAYPGKGAAWGLCRETDAVLEANPPGPYALLAMRVLEAGVFGIKSELAVFDEKAPAAAEAA